jgi:hypothetical protein
MKAREASDLGVLLEGLVRTGQIPAAYAQLAPVLAQRTPFPILGRIGSALGAGPLEQVTAFLEHVASHGTEGGWVVIGMALQRQLDRDLEDALARCQGFIITGDIWYCADILAERVPGQALVDRFDRTLPLLRPWHEHSSAWVRRSVGTAAHFWAKRSRGAVELKPHARLLLGLLEPMFGEWEIDAVKGVGWGLKTLGRVYPELLADWLAADVVPARRRHRTLMLRKALTYLTEEQRARAVGKDAA